MVSFDVLELNNNKYRTLIVLMTPEAPFRYLGEISDALSKMNIKGYILIDELMHSGNSEDRFILAYFDGKEFDTHSFSFEAVERRSELRKLTCELLRKNPDVIEYSTLNNNQKKLIANGVFI